MTHSGIKPEELVVKDRLGRPLALVEEDTPLPLLS